MIKKEVSIFYNNLPPNLDHERFRDYSTGFGLVVVSVTTPGLIEIVSGLSTCVVSTGVSGFEPGFLGLQAITPRAITTNNSTFFIINF